MSEVLVTGFEPFGGDSVNPSWEVARTLDGWRCGNARVRAVQLPCRFDRAAQALELAMAAGPAPQLVIALGLAGGRVDWTPERVAINCNDARIADNGGQQPVDTPVVEGGPAAYFSTLPIKAMVQAVRAAGLPASVSNSAGTFVCNHVFYALMHLLATRPQLVGTRGGFIHVPALPQQAARLPGMPSMALAHQAEAMQLSIHTALTTERDIVQVGGQIH